MQCHNIAKCTSKVSSLLFTSVYMCSIDQEVTKTFFQFSRLIFIRGLQATGLSSLTKATYDYPRLFRSLLKIILIRSPYILSYFTLSIIRFEFRTSALKTQAEFLEI